MCIFIRRKLHQHQISPFAIFLLILNRSLRIFLPSHHESFSKILKKRRVTENVTESRYRRTRCREHKENAEIPPRRATCRTLPLQHGGEKPLAKKILPNVSCSSPIKIFTGGLSRETVGGTLLLCHPCLYQVPVSCFETFNGPWTMPIHPCRRSRPPPA